MFIEAGLITVGALGLGITGLTAWSFIQKSHSGPRIYGPIYLTRYIAESLRPKFSQYLERPGDGRPFSLVNRNWVYRASKGVSTYEGFGTTKDLHEPGTTSLIPAPFGITLKEMPNDSFRHTIGSGENSFESHYPVWRSAMSFGAIGAMATRALSDGVAILGEGAMDNTGEGGLSIHHVPVNDEGEWFRSALNARAKKLGRNYTFRFDKTATSDGKVIDVPLDLRRSYIDKNGKLKRRNRPLEGLGASEKNRNIMIQIGPSMAGLKTKAGEVDWNWINYLCCLSFVRGFEIKIHQGAKPNDGGTVSAKKLTKEIVALRGIPIGEDYHSPERLPFIKTTEVQSQINELGEFIHKFRNLSGFKNGRKILGIKTTFCGGELAEGIARLCKEERGPDYIQVDGSEGGTGSADTVMTDRVGYDTFYGLRKYNEIFVKAGARNKITLIASGRLVEPGVGVMALCTGADLIASARGPLMSLGCIQARECHTGHCPSGIATHNSWRLRGLDPRLKSVRYANYVLKYRDTVMKLARTTGVNLSNGKTFSPKNVWMAE